ncbi:hypothetical protein Tco_0504805 [Tanacetum coccineum]
MPTLRRDLPENVKFPRWGEAKVKTSFLEMKSCGIGDIDGLDGTECGYQGLCLGEMFCLFKQKDALEKKSLFNDYDCKIRYHLVKANIAADTLSIKERAKPLRVGALVMTINLNLPPQIHETQVEALRKENVKDKNFHGTNKDFEARLDRTLCIRIRNWLSHRRDLRKFVPMAHYGSRHHHLCQQVLDMSKDEGRLSEAIRFTRTTRNTPLEMGKYSHGFYHKPAKDNKLLLHDLGNRDHQKNYANVRRKPLEF